MLALSVADTIIKIKIALDRREEPFLGYLAKFHKFIPMPDDMKKFYNIQDGKKDIQFLMCVNAKAEVYYYEPDCVKLTEKELCGVVAHEIIHTMLRHTTHTPDTYDPTIANVAQDLVVNWHCIQANFSLPKNDKNAEEYGSLIPDYSGKAIFVLRLKTELGDTSVQFIIKDIPKKHWIEIYKEIISEIENKTGTKFNSSKMLVTFEGVGKIDGHDFKSKPENNDITSPCSDEYWKFKIAEAAEHAKSKGNMHSNFKSFLDKLLTPKINWRDKLRTAFITSVGNEITWQRPKRNAICRDLHLPTVYSDTLKAIISIDSSGSISNNLLKQFMTEVAAILSACQSVELDLLIGDTQLKHHAITNRDLDELTKIPIEGRGGTSHRDLVKWVNEHAENAKLLIVLTDGYSDIESCFDQLPSTCKTLIVLGESDKSVAEKLEPFGQIIIIEDDSKDYE